MEEGDEEEEDLRTKPSSLFGFEFEHVTSASSSNHTEDGYQLEQVTIDRFENDQISQHIQTAFSGFSREEPFEEGRSDRELVLLDLPDSVLLKIFSNLSHPELCRIALVCKHWLWIVFDSELWKYVDFSQCNNVTEEHVLNLIRSRLSPLLKMVDLSNCPVTPIVFHELTDNFQQLETLVLQNSSYKEDDDTTKVNTELQRVSVPENLIRLDLRNFKAGFQFVHLILEVAGMNQLECFGFGNDSFCPTFKDFQALLGSMRSLRILECVDCESITDSQLTVVFDQLRNLESLVLKKCKNVTGSNLNQLILSAEKLKTLNLSGTNLTDAAVQQTAWEISKIEELDFSFCDQLTSVGLSDSLWKIKTLQYLVLNNTGRGRAVTATIFQNAASNAAWKDLTNLTFHFSNRLNGDALVSLRHCTNLKRISLRTCHNITFDDISQNLEYFPHLVSLECGSLFPLDQSSNRWIQLIENLSKHCLNLKYLTILKCAEVPISKISTYKATIMQFVERCVKLHTIAVLYSERAISQLFEDCASKVNRHPAIKVSNAQTCTTMPPFRHSLDSEINRQKFQKFFGY